MFIFLYCAEKDHFLWLNSVNKCLYFYECNVYTTILLFYKICFSPVRDVSNDHVVDILLFFKFPDKIVIYVFCNFTLR